MFKILFYFFKKTSHYFSIESKDTRNTTTYNLFWTDKGDRERKKNSFARSKIKGMVRT